MKSILILLKGFLSLWKPIRPYKYNKDRCGGLFECLITADDLGFLKLSPQTMLDWVSFVINPYFAVFLKQDRFVKIAFLTFCQIKRGILWGEKKTIFVNLRIFKQIKVKGRI